MSTAAAAPTGFSIGRVISRPFGVLGRNFVPFLLLSVLLVGLPTAGFGYVQLSVRTLPIVTAGTSSADPPADEQPFSPFRSRSRRRRAR